MATIVPALWLAAERVLFSCNDGHYGIFSRLDDSFELSKTMCAWAKATEKMDKVQLYFQ